MKRQFSLLVVCLVFLIGLWLERKRLVTDVVIPPAPTALTESVKLFSIPYGDAPEKIGMHIPEGETESEPVAGPSHFTVAGDGTFWFFDHVNRQIKQFDRNGKLVRYMKSTLPGGKLGIAPDGYVYVVGGNTELQFEVFDDKGQEQPEIAKRLIKAVRTVSPTLDIVLYGLDTDAQGNLHGQTFLNKQPFTLRLTRSGEVTILPPGRVDETGHVWELKRSENKQTSVSIYKANGDLLTSYDAPAFVIKQIIVHNPTGQSVRQFNLPSTGLLPLEQSLEEVMDYRVRRGHLYMLAPSLARHWKEVIGALEVLQWFVVMEYDGQGNRIGVRAVLNEPIHTSLEDLWDVDQQGNVYWLEFKVDHLDVMMAPVPQ